MKSLYSVILLLATALLTACASGPKMMEVQSSIPALQANEGRVFFYRSGSMMGAAIQPNILVNGKVAGESKPGGFFFVTSAPGPMEVAVSTEVEKKLTFTLEAGQTRYVRTKIGFGVIAGRVYPELVDPAEATKELAETSYIGTPLPKR
jgi:Protein of unknown function (DUF2846)